MPTEGGVSQTEEREHDDADAQLHRAIDRLLQDDFEGNASFGQ